MKNSIVHIADKQYIKEYLTPIKYFFMHNMWNKLMAFADNHAESKTLLFLISLIGQGVLFLPIPALLIFYYDAPIIVLIISLSLFFANIIAGMGGSGMHALVAWFALSILVHLIMLAVFII
jgi:hypothetical protein